MVLKQRQSVHDPDRGFENDVKMYGTQTIPENHAQSPPFENDVKMYGTQTNTELLLQNLRLRMM